MLDEAGLVVAWPDGLASRIVIDDEEVVVAMDGGRFQASKAGTTGVHCEVGELVDASPASVNVIPGAVASVSTTVDKSTVSAGDDGVTVGCEVLDAVGNVISDAAVTVDVLPWTSGRYHDGHAVFTGAGDSLVRCSAAGAIAPGAMVTVEPGAPHTVAVSVDEPEAAPGMTVKAEVLVTDAYGNHIDDAEITTTAAAGLQATGAPNEFTVLDGDAPVVIQVQAKVDSTTVTGSTTVAVNKAEANDGPPRVTCGTRMSTVPTANTTSAFSGTVVDGDGIRSVTVEGVAATITDTTVVTAKSFRATVPTAFGLNVVTVVATDNLGTTFRRDCGFIASPIYMSETAPMPGAVSLAAGPEAVDDHDAAGPIDSVGDLVSKALTGPVFAGLVDTTLRQDTVLASNVCVANTTLGCLTRATLTYVPGSLSVGTVSVPLSLSATGLTGNATATTIRIGFNALVGADPNAPTAVRIGGNGTLDTVTGTVTFRVSAANGFATATLIPESLVLGVNGIHASFTWPGLLAAFGPVLDGLVMSVLGGEVDQIVRDTMRSVLTSRLDGVINDVLRSISVDTAGLGIALPLLSNTGNMMIDVGGTITTANVNATRVFATVAPDLRVSGGTAIGNSSPGVPVLASSASQVSGGEQALNTRPVAVGIHEAVINQLLHKLWRNGYLRGNVDLRVIDRFAPGFDITSTISGLAELLGLNAIVDVGAVLGALHISIASANIPPVGQILPTGRLRVGLGGITISIMIDGLLAVPLRINVNAIADALVTVRDGNLALADLDIVDFGFALEDLGLSLRLNEAIDPLLTGLLNGLIEGVLGIVLVGIPVPELHLPSQVGPVVLPPNTILDLTAPTLVTSGQRFVLRAGLLQR